VTLPPAQHSVLVELLRRVLALDNCDDAALIVDHLRALRTHGEGAPTIMQWLSLLPRARGGLQVTIKSAFATVHPLPPHVQAVMDGTRASHHPDTQRPRRRPAHPPPPRRARHTPPHTRPMHRLRQRVRDATRPPWWPPPNEV